ncbi:MAG: hypothetical protein ACKOGJ_00795, partial [Phycisphaerales bacterium]
MGLALAAVACAAAATVAVPPGDGAFGGLSVAPADAQLVVRVRDGRSLRSDPALVPLEGALAELAGSRTLEEGWDRLAETLGLSPDALLDRLFGTDAVYVERASSGAAAAEWAIVTRTDPAFHAELVERLKPAAAAAGSASIDPSASGRSRSATHADISPVRPVGPITSHGGRHATVARCASSTACPPAAAAGFSRSTSS